MLDAWIIEELKRKKEEEERKIENDNSIRLPIHEDKPCLENEPSVEYPPEIEINA